MPDFLSSVVGYVVGKMGRTIYIYMMVHWLAIGILFAWTTYSEIPFGVCAWRRTMVLVLGYGLAIPLGCGSSCEELLLFDISLGWCIAWVDNGIGVRNGRSFEYAFDRRAEQLFRNPFHVSSVQVSDASPDCLSIAWTVRRKLGSMLLLLSPILMIMALTPVDFYKLGRLSCSLSWDFLAMFGVCLSAMMVFAIGVECPSILM